MTTTTLTAINGQNGVELRTVIAVEGLQYLLTDGSTTAEIAAAVTAWAATDYTTALGGAAVSYNLDQRLNPWGPFETSSSSVTIAVTDVSGTNADTLAVAIFKREGMTTSPLSSAGGATEYDPADTGIKVRSTGSFSSSGTAYLGCEAFDYDSTDGTRFIDCTRGKWSPFEIQGGGGLGRTHTVTPTVPGVDPEAIANTFVATAPIEWKGRYIGVWLHRVIDGVLDVKAQAHCVFAGKIAEVAEDAKGRVIIQCISWHDVLRETVILRDQWRGRLAEGVWVKAGTEFTAYNSRGGTPGEADPLIVVPSGASAPYEINEGFYSGDALQSKINDWMSQAKADGDLLFRMTFVYIDDNQGTVCSSLKFSDTAAGLSQREWSIGCSNRDVRTFFGWGSSTTLGESTALDSSIVYSPETPLRFHPWAQNAPGESTFHVEQVTGSFVDQSAFIPIAISNLVTSCKGVIKVGNQYFPCEQPSVSNGEGSVVAHRAVTDILGVEAQFGDLLTVNGEGHVEVCQVLCLESSFKTLVLTLLASTGGGTNWPDYDVLPGQVSAALPYDLLTTDLEAELGASPVAEDVMRVIVEKPTRLPDVWNVSFILRHLQLIWRNGRIALTGFQTPTSAATLSIGADDRASSSAMDDDMRGKTKQSDQWLRNVITIKSNGGPIADEYLDTTLISIPGSAANYGARPVTLSARNAAKGAGTAMEDIAALLDTFCAPLSILAQPATIITVPIHFNLFEQATPGTVCLFSDSHARDPATGTRSVTDRPALIVGQRIMGWGGESGDPIGEIDVMLFPRIALAPYSPCAQVDDTATNAGYNAGTKVLTCYAHEHSEGTAVADATRFPATSKVRIIEIDPATAASPLTWDDVVASQTGNTITLTTGLAGWDNTKKYRVYSDDYGDATTAQKANAYQADADGFVADARAPYQLFLSPVGQALVFTSSVATSLAERPPTAAYGDGVALDTGHTRAAARGLNNLIAYGTAVQAPQVIDECTYSGGSTWLTVFMDRVFVAQGTLAAGLVRKLYVAPWMASTSGTSAIRVTLSRVKPRSADPSVPSREDVVFLSPYAQTTFAPSSATYSIATAAGLNTSVLALGEGAGSGTGWITVELQANAKFRGFGEFRVGPPEAP